MSKKGVDRHSLIQAAVDGRYTVKEVSKRLGLSERRVKQLMRRVREVGASGVIHGNSGRHPSNFTTEELRRRIITLKESTLKRGGD
ncbi:MAG: helix-turn-helix domain-containing protein [Deferribacteraceae bacterium]|nr:helix-turn-helix domain-containing protein [Deferribacteraceae bacterium]